MASTYKSLEQALELAAYRCDLETFNKFIDRVETAIESRADAETLEKEIHERIGKTRSRIFNIHKVANDATTNIAAA